MTDYESFTEGFSDSFSWKDGLENARIGSEPTIYYLFGVLTIGFLSLAALFFIISIFINQRKKYSSWYEALRAMPSINSLHQSEFMTYFAVFALPLVLFVLLLGIGMRIKDGIHHYQYFTSHETRKVSAKLTEINIETKGRKEKFTGATMTLVIEGKVHKVNIANVSETMAKDLKDRLKLPTHIYVYVNKGEQVVFID